MKIPGNQPIFCLRPIQKQLHLGIPDRVLSNGEDGGSLDKTPVYGCNATGRLISWEIHYRPFHVNNKN